jgi:disulfide bond formation protein DsbB
MKNSKRGTFALLSSLTLFLVFAFYHLGVENHWWNGPAKCSTIISSPQNISEIMETKQNVKCDEANWKIFGLSSTLYNFIIAGVLFWIYSLAFAIDRVIRRSEDE